MQRRQFVKLSATTMAALMLSRLTYANGENLFVNNPDEVWAQTDDGWFKLTLSGNYFSFRDIFVTTRSDKSAVGIYVQSPSLPLSGLRFKWKHSAPSVTKVLGDSWERTYGDAGWKAPNNKVKNPWYMLLHDGVQTACFGVKTGCNAICWWTINAQSLELSMDTRSGGVGVELGARTLHAADIITAQSVTNETPFTTTQRFCKLMCPKPRLPKQPVYGINDWYYAYGNNSPKLIKEQTALLSALAPDNDNRPFSVIDAGWAAYSPLLPDDCCWQEDFSRPNAKFKDMHLMAQDIVKLGMRPGLWMRPLCAKHNDNLNLLAPKIKGRDDPKNPVLDPTIPENIERIKTNIYLYKQWGFQLVKHDFSTYDITGRWGFDMNDTITQAGWRFYERSRTTAEIMNNLYYAIREAADDMYLIGCNTMSHLSAGMFELNRTGDDTSGKDWARTRKMGVNTLGFRMPQHNHFYAIDGDCVGVTSQVPWNKNRQWMQLLAESSAPLFISAQPDALGSEQRDFIKQCFSLAAKSQPCAEPMDWLTTSLPARWLLNNREVNFDWS